MTQHVGATPELVASADVTPDEARSLLDLDALREVHHAHIPTLSSRAGVRALDGFLLDQHAASAARVIAALRAITPNATTAADLARHLALEMEAIHGALDLLATSLRAAGWTNEAVVRGRGWHSARRGRSNRNGFIDQVR